MADVNAQFSKLAAQCSPGNAQHSGGLLLIPPSEFEHSRQQEAIHVPMHFGIHGRRIRIRLELLADEGFHIKALAGGRRYFVVGIRPQRGENGHLKAEATRALRAQGWYEAHTPWAEHGWNVYLDSVADVERAIRYVENNPELEGKRRQTWTCVAPFDPAAMRGANSTI